MRLFFGFLSACGIATFSVGIAQTSYWFPRNRQGSALGTFGGLGNLAPGIFSIVLPLFLIRFGFISAYFAWFLFLLLGTVLYGIIGVNSYFFQFRRAGLSDDDANSRARDHGQEIFPSGGVKESLLNSAGINHWFHTDMIYRSAINMLMLCGCVGESGGGWAHYVGQEKLRPQTGWLPLAFALDWNRPPRQMNTTSFFYMHSDQWHCEKVGLSELVSPLADKDEWSRLSMIDCNVKAERMGWLPSGPQLGENPLTLCRKAEKEGRDIEEYITSGLKSNEIAIASEDPDNPKNFPRNLFVWRSNLLGSSAKGMEYFMKHLLGTQNSVLGSDLKSHGGQLPTEVRWHDKAPEGKLDLLVTIDFRMSTTA